MLRTLYRLSHIISMAVLTLVLLAVPGQAKQHHVRTNGSASGDGSSANAWDLRTALNHPATVLAGDTIWLHGGTYAGTFESFLTGTATRPIIIRSYPGEWAIIDNGGTDDTALWIKGDYSWFWGFEVMSSNPVPTRGEGGIDLVASEGTKLINIVVHDEGATGFNPYSASTNAEIYGCLAYYNGREDDPSLRNGYGIYGQNNSPGTKTVSDCFFFNNFGIFQIHMTGSSNANLDNMSFVGNTVFGHSLYDNKNIIALYGNFETGSGKNQNPVWSSNFFYHADLWLGYNGDGVENAVFTDNYFLSGTARENAGNSYASRSGNVFTSSGNQVFVRPNKYADQYDGRRASIIVFNGSGASAVSVSLPPGVLNVGDTYQILDIENWKGSPVESGTYNGGALTIHMPGAEGSISTPQTIPVYRPGHSQPTHSNSDFGAFILMSGQGNGTIPSVSGTLNANPASLPAGGGSVTLTWSSQNATSASIDQGIGSVQPVGSMTVQVTESKTFTLTLNGTGGPVTSQVPVQVASATLSGTTLVSPADGSTTALSSMMLSWNAVTGASSYQVQVSRDSAFTSLLLNDQAVTGTSRTVSGLENGGAFYWRVRAQNASVIGAYSSVWRFESSVGKNETTFPIDLQGAPPEASVITIAVNKPSGLDYAIIDLWVYDADGANEGRLHVNEADSLTLFGSAAAPIRDRSLTMVTMSMSANSWTQGLNTLRFEHTSTAGFRVDSVAVRFSDRPATSVAPRIGGPSSFALAQNYPNPFNPTTIIPFSLAQRGKAVLSVYNVLGQEIATLVNEELSAGSYQAEFNAPGLSSGIYFYRLSAGGEISEMRRMAFLK